jgi:hypothetical protein
MDFVSSQYNNTIPSKSTFVPSDNQLEYTDNQTIRFQIPKFMGFIDSRQTYLKMKVSVRNSPAVLRLSNKCGSHALIDQLRVYDGNTNAQLETIQNYGELAEMLHHYTENRTIRNKRGITEAVEYTSRDYDNKINDDLPSRSANNSMFFNSYQTGGGATQNATSFMDGLNATDGYWNGTESNEVEVAMRLYSGILGEPNNKMFPAMLTDGLRVEMDLASAGKAFQLWSGAGVCSDAGEVLPDTPESCRFGIINCSQGAGQTLDLKLYTEYNAGYNQIVFGGGGGNGAELPEEAYDVGARLVSNQLVGAFNLLRGKVLHAFPNDNAVNVEPVLVNLGKILSVSCNSGENNGGLMCITLNVENPNNVAPTRFQGGAGVNAGGVQPAERCNTCCIRQTDMLNSIPELVIKDVELVVKTAQPPPSYIEALMKGTQTEEGASYDYYSWNVYRNNITSSEQVVQLNVPALNMRATSALVKPIENGKNENVLNNNFESVVDNCKDYNFLIANKQQPTQRVSVANLSHLSPTGESEPLVEQVALFETEKALGSSKMAVKNLDHQSDNFVIGRALARYGGVYPLVKDGGFQLRVNYKSAPQTPQKNKLFITYVGGLRRLVVGTGGVQVQV